MVTKEKLERTANEINNVVPLDHPIEYEDTTKRELKEQIIAVAEQAIEPEEDELSETTIAVLEALECSPYEPLNKVADEMQEHDEEMPDSTVDEAPPAPVKPEKKDKPEKQGRPGTKTAQIRNKIVEIVKRGDATRSECVNEIAGLGFNKHTVNSQLYMCSDPKYNKLDRLVVMKEDGTLGFDV